MLIPKQGYLLPKIIWCYWDTEEKPKLIKQIEKNNKSKLAGWSIIYLNADTLKMYINENDFPRNYGSLISQHKADWLRVYLLEKYGGCWMDASIILNHKDAIDKLWQESVYKESDFTGFYTDSKFHSHSSGAQIPLNIENWFIMVPAGSHIIKQWRKEYEKAIEIGFPSYRDKLLAEGVNLTSFYPGNKPLSPETKDDVYFCQHLCIQKIFQQKYKLPSYILKDSDETMFRVRNECHEKNPKLVDKCTMNAILKDVSVKALPYIKLTRYERATGIDISEYFAAN